jgi:hypothetical protein
MAEESQEAARSTEQVLEDRTSTMQSSQECFDSLAPKKVTFRLFWRYMPPYKRT